MNRIKKYILDFKPRVEYKLTHMFRFATPSGTGRYFFPGCSLTGGDPELVKKTLEYLQINDPDIGIWFDCCGEPLEMYSPKKHARKAHDDFVSFAMNNNVSEIITACGNCYLRFDTIAHLLPGIRVTFLYDLLLEKENVIKKKQFVVHHPCPARKNNDLRQSVTTLLSGLELKVENIENKEHALSCCLIRNQHAREKKKQLKDKHVLTYCGHCVKSFQKELKISHVLEILFGKNRFFKKMSLVRNLLRYRTLKKMFRIKI